MNIEKMQKEIDDEIKAAEVSVLRELACMIAVIGCAFLVGALLIV